MNLDQPIFCHQINKQETYLLFQQRVEAIQSQELLKLINLILLLTLFAFFSEEENKCTKIIKFPLLNIIYSHFFQKIFFISLPKWQTSTF